MSRHRAHHQLQAISRIDVTPLMDLTFLLLIVFMITAPTLEYAVDVTPPAYDGQVIEDTVSREINIDRQGQLRLEGAIVPREQLVARLREQLALAPGLEVFVRADEVRAYGEVIGVMRMVRESGIQKVKLVTQPEGQH